MKILPWSLFATSLLLAISASSVAQLTPINLTCENVVHPLGIDISNPRLRWNFATIGKNQTQVAYEINFTDKANDFTKGWKTKRVLSNRSAFEYREKALQSFTRYYWRVRVVDDKNVLSPWSEPAWFETAALDQNEWKAEWITDGSKQVLRDRDFYSDDRMPLFRKEFTLQKKIKNARLYIAGLGYYEAYLNGKKVGDRVFEPGWTTYSKQVLYSVYDVTPYLKSGQNIAGVMLGNGWYNPLPLKLFSRFNLRDFQQTGRPCLKAEIHVEYSDGSKEKITSNNSWLYAPGPIIRNNVYLGEQYDATLEQPNWLNSVTDNAQWKPALPTKGPTGTLTVQMQPPIRVTKIVKPISIHETTPGVFIADMGQNFAGVARIRVTGKTGTKVMLKYGEALHADGSLNYLTTVAGQIKEIWSVNGGEGAPATAWQEDAYILKGTGVEEWSPRFTFHGFRYVEIKGWPGVPDLNSIEGLRMNSDLTPVGKFSCSNELFNKIHEAVQWTFLSNVFSVQSDCPGREKMGYGADMVATANAFMYNFDMSNFYRKAVHDFANDQQPDGGITEIAPFTGIADKGYGGLSGPLGWQLAFLYLQKQLYEFYGDTQIIEEQYPNLQKQLEFLQAHAIDGLFHWDIGDHEALDPKPEAFSAAAFYYHHALLAKEFASILNRHEDTSRYSTLAKRIKHNIRDKYYIPGTGRFDNATQSAQLFALWYDLSPEKEKTRQVLLDEFKRHNNHVSAGIFGVKMMFDVLRESDLTELAYTVANQKDFPSWGYMLATGATTLWETWKYPDNAPSQNHPMFGSVDEWFYRSLLGISSLAPGFEKIKIKPQPSGDLTWANGSFQSINGLIVSDWKIENKQFSLHVVIPANTKAQIWMPSGKASEVEESHGFSTEGKVSGRGKHSVIEVGSGEYYFQCPYFKE